MTLEELKHIREITLRNAESLISAARLLVGREFDHIRYHLATLALEEVGKAGLLGMKFAADTLKGSGEEIDRYLDDHVKKLFWAIWGPSFGREKITRDQIVLYEGLATRIHERRLYYLYVDPKEPLPPQDKVDPRDVDNLVQLTEARIGLEKSHTLVDLDKAAAGELRWFIGATEDPERRKEIFGTKSMEKLAELGEVKKWISWLRETYEEHEKEMREMLQRELKRSHEGDEGEIENPKWRLRIRIYSHSHSIRPKAFTEWNKYSDFIKLSATGKRVYSRSKKDEIICDFILPRRVPVQALWDYGWGLSRMFVTALNIATRGFFWWYVPQDTERFYEEILDLENNAGVRAEPSKKLELDWGNWALDDRDMSRTGLMFGYLARIRGRKEEEPLNAYITGLTFFSKIDWHLRLEMNAFEDFWRAFKLALETSGDWDGTPDALKAAAARQIGDILPTTDNLGAFIDLGSKFEAAKPVIENLPEITLTEVVGMKLYCDLYFLKLAKRMMERVEREEKRDSSVLSQKLIA